MSLNFSGAFVTSWGRAGVMLGDGQLVMGDDEAQPPALIALSPHPFLVNVFLNYLEAEF